MPNRPTRHRKTGPIRKAAETLLGGAAGIGAVTAVAALMHSGAAQPVAGDQASGPASVGQPAAPSQPADGGVDQSVVGVTGPDGGTSSGTTGSTGTTTGARQGVPTNDGTDAHIVSAPIEQSGQQGRHTGTSGGGHTPKGDTPEPRSRPTTPDPGPSKPSQPGGSSGDQGSQGSTGSPGSSGTSGSSGSVGSSGGSGPTGSQPPVTQPPTTGGGHSQNPIDLLLGEVAGAVGTAVAGLGLLGGRH